MDDLKLFHAFINDFWQFVKAHWTLIPNDEHWTEVLRESKALTTKYNNHPAVIFTMLGYLDYLEHEGSGRERVRKDSKD